MDSAHYRKYNDRTLNSSTYHKKDGTNIRAKLKVDLKKEVQDNFGIGIDLSDKNEARKFFEQYKAYSYAEIAAMLRLKGSYRRKFAKNLFEYAMSKMTLQESGDIMDDICRFQYEDVCRYNYDCIQEYLSKEVK